MNYHQQNLSKQVRLNKFIAENSRFSRRKADELIEQGKVRVNNFPAKMGSSVDPEQDSIFVNGKEIKAITEKVYFALNKPKGYITTRSDEQNRKTVMELLPKIKNLKPAGRLDKDTEGLLLLSNDGDFIYRLTHPSFECEKTYYTRVRGELKKDKKGRLEKGIIIDGRKTHPAQINIISQNEKETSLTIKIHEGRNRQIRKMFDKIGHPVKYLRRTQIGKVTLGDLKVGEYKKLTNPTI